VLAQELGIAPHRLATARRGNVAPLQRGGSALRKLRVELVARRRRYGAKRAPVGGIHRRERGTGGSCTERIGHVPGRVDGESQ